MSNQILKWALAGAAAWMGVSSPGQADDWTRFRGPNGGGVVSGVTIPTTWDATTNIRWKVEMPGPGSSCPIVIGDRVILTCYTGYGVNAEEPGSPENLKRHLICFDLVSGKQLWQTDVASTENEDEYKGFITEHGYASSTPTSNGKQVFAFFGKSGLYAFDMEGKQLWNKPLGVFSDPAKWGDGTSPMLYKDLVIVNAGITGHAIVALKQSDGTEAWRIDNEKFTNCWSTPVLVEVAGREELVFSMPGTILAVNPETGAELWSAKSPIDQTVCASLAVSDDVVFAMGGRAGVGVAVRCGGTGDVSATHTVWEGRLRAGIGTPIAVDGHLYWSTSGKMYCASCATGEEVYQKDLVPPPATNEGERRRPAGDYASPILVGDNLIIVTRSGRTSIVKAGTEFAVTSTNSFGDDPGPFNATPAVAAESMLIRSNQTLYCIGK